MIPFDISKMTVDHVWLKGVTTGSGGRITVVDKDKSTKAKDVYKQINSDWSIVRRFAKVNEASRFLNPVLCAVAYYDGKMIALEMNPLGSKAEDEMDMGDGVVTKWKSQIEKNVDLLLNDTKEGDWFVDGFSVYQFANGQEENLSSDGRFQSVPVESYKLLSMDTRAFALRESRVCLKYTTKGNVLQKSVSAMSPPIWKSLTTVGSKEMKKSKDDTGVCHTTVSNHQFDRVDNLLAVNVDFALKAARELSEVFGYESIEPLNLDYLMVELGTVNLPTVDKSVRQTMDIGIQFTHAMSWLIGLIHRTDTLDAYMSVRGVMKYLTGLGIYRKKAFEADSVYKNGADINSIPLMGIDEAVESYEKRLDGMDFSEWVELNRLEESRGRTRRADTATGLMTED